MKNRLKLTFVSEDKYSQVATELTELVDSTLCGKTVSQNWEQQLEAYAANHTMKITLNLDFIQSTMNHLYFTVKV